MTHAFPAAGALLAAALVAAAPAVVRARELPPAPPTYVLDEGGWLPAGEESRLSERLLAYERETSNQIVVAVFSSLEDEDLADFSQRVAEAWGIGRAEHDNGILLAVYVAERQIDIEVGYGLEAVVTDLVADDIRRNVLVPAFRAGRNAEGVVEGAGALMAAARGEYQGTGRALSDEDRPRGMPPLALLVLALIVLVVITRMRTGGGMLMGPPGWGDGGRGYRSFPRGGFGGGGLGGGFGGFGGGGGGFGGGGGGFRGGGGSFGGGGARGGW